MNRAPRGALFYWRALPGANPAKVARLWRKGFAPHL